MSRHLATFNLFREASGDLYITIADARGVKEELGLEAGRVPLHLMAMKAITEAVRQHQERQRRDDDVRD